MAVLAPFIGEAAAERVLLFAWPLGWLALAMVLVTRICARLGEASGLARESAFAGALLAAMAMPGMVKFAPGGLDHHNVELVLVLAAIDALQRLRSGWRAGVQAGLALGVALVTAAEALPFMAACFAAGGVMWLVRPDGLKPALLGLAGGAALATLAGLMVAPATPAGQPVCDAISPTFLWIVLSAGAAAAVLALAPAAAMRTISCRLAWGGLAAATGGAGLLLAAPACLGGGYSQLDPAMMELWMSQIAEARSLADLAADDPGLMLSLAGSALFGLAVVIARPRAAAPDLVLPVAVCLAAACAVMAWQVRGALFASVLAVPPSAVLVAAARRNWREGAGVRGLVVFVAVGLASCAAAWHLAGEKLRAAMHPPELVAGHAARTASAQDCVEARAYAPLAGLAPGVMLNPFMTGPALLLHTRHAATGALYHRNVEGTLRGIDAFRSNPEAARGLVVAAGADYVLACPALPETGFSRRNALGSGETLAAMLADGRHPDWLEPVPLEGETPLRVYRVLPGL